MSTLEERIARLEDIQEITTLTARYADAVNQGWNGKTTAHDRLGDFFTEDASWASPARGVSARGLVEIRALLDTSNPPGRFAMHSFTNPVIEVDGDHATGRWLLWVAIGPEAPNQVFQSETLEYVRTDAGWRITTLTLDFGQMLLAP